MTNRSKRWVITGCSIVLLLGVVFAVAHWRASAKESGVSEQQKQHRAAGSTVPKQPAKFNRRAKSLPASALGSPRPKTTVIRIVIVLIPETSSHPGSRVFRQTEDGKPSSEGWKPFRRLGQ